MLKFRKLIPIHRTFNKEFMSFNKQLFDGKMQNIIKQTNIFFMWGNMEIFNQKKKCSCNVFFSFSIYSFLAWCIFTLLHHGNKFSRNVTFFLVVQEFCIVFFFFFYTAINLVYKTASSCSENNSIKKILY